MLIKSREATLADFIISGFFKTVLNFWKLYQIITSRDFIFSRFDAKQSNRGLKKEFRLSSLNIDTSIGKMVEHLVL